MTRFITIFTMVFTLMMTQELLAQSPQEQVRTAVKTFVAGSDAQNVEAIDAVLHPSYRVVWHDGQKADPMLVDKATYLAKIQNKEWGGDQRTVVFEEVLLTSESNATAKVTLKGKAADFHSQFSLINADGNWQLVQDLVTATFK